MRARPLVDVPRGGESRGEVGQEAHGEGSRQEEAGGVCLPSLPPSVSQITQPPSVQLPSASLVRRQKGGRHGASCVEERKGKIMI